MRNKVLKAITILVIFLSVQIVKSQPGCPSIEAGNDQSLNCQTSCTNLSSSVLATGATTSYAVSSIPYAPPYPYNTGTPILVSQDDVWGSVITLPFTFCFWGVSYNKIVAGSNGCISFGPANANASCAWSYTVSCPNPNIISGSTGPYVLGPYQDIDPAVSGSGNMYYAILGTYPCRTFVISWDHIPEFSCTTLISTNQIVLYESTNVIEVYMLNKPLCSTWNSGNATIGIQNAAGTQGICPPGRNTGQWTAANEAWRFTPNGTPNYTTYWYQGSLSSTPIDTNQATITVCPTSSTTYYAQVVYNCCTGLDVIVNDSVTVNVNNSIGLAITPSAPSICNGNSVTLNATCTDPTATYQWSGGGPATSTYTVTPTSTTTYTVTATTTMCTTHTPVTVTVNPNPSTITGNNSPICAGSDLNITYADAGDTYVWSGPNGFSSSDQNPTITGATPSATGTYYVTVTTPAGCTANAQTSATVNPNPVATASSNSPVCTGNTLNLTSGGGTSYNWSGPNGFTSTNQNPTISGVTSLATGTYLVTVTGVGGCTDTTHTVVLINVTPTPTISNNSPLCAGDTLKLTAGGGSGYNWSGPSGFTSTLQNPTLLNTTVSESGNYVVTVTDINGCFATTQTAVTINPLPVATITSNSPVCFGNTLNMNTGGGSTFVWAGPNGFSNTTQNPSITPVVFADAGVYSVTVTGIGGCSSTNQMTVVVNPNPTYTSVVDSVKCHGGATGSITLTPSGGTQPYSYTWNPSEPNSPAVTSLLAGTYHVTVTDNNGCDTTGSFTVYQPQSVVLSLNPTNEKCPGNCNGLINSNVSGGTGSFTYNWGGGQHTPNISNLCVGNYSLTVTDANGCTASSSNSVATSWSVNASFTVSDTMGVYPFTVNFTNTSSGASIYYWDFADGNTSTLENPTHTFADSGLYHVMLIVNSGNPYDCADTFYYYIDVIVPSMITVPNVFTPNGDTKNDEFRIDSKGIGQFSCQIYNRWGKKIYDWDDITKGWDGKTKGGQNADDGVYYYILYARGLDKIEYNQHGTVTLLRK